MRTLASYTAGRENNLNLVRFVAASAVLFSHSYAISGHITREPLAQRIGFVDFGSVAVIVFFAISGFLIAQSWDRSPQWSAFVRARVLRLIPGLIGATLFTALVVGPLSTDLSLAQYFRSRALYVYVAENLRFDGAVLPGVFDHNPLHGAVNGSLWTVSVEVWCYAAVAIAGVIGVLRRPWLLAAVAAAAVIAQEVWPNELRAHLPRPEAYMAVRFVGTFLIGVLAYAYRKAIPLNPVLALIAIGIAFATWRTEAFVFAFYLTIAYCVFVFAWHPAFDVPAFRKLGDYSYGIYIFAFPIQQLVMAKAGPLGPLHLFAAAFPLTLLAAAASWHTIERPALRSRAGNATGRRSGTWRRDPAMGALASRER